MDAKYVPQINKKITDQKITLSKTESTCLKHLNEHIFL